jgi:large subunit ribosomal protein L30
MQTLYAAVRVKGKIGVRREIRLTLDLLRLTRANHCILIQANDTNKGMLQKVKDYITWGEINKETLNKLVRERGRLTGDKPITDDWVKTHMPFQEKVKYKELPDVKPVFRLHPPRKGWGHTKRSFKEGGVLGYRGKEINKLIERMI